jgi:hypothetical protein
MCIFSYWIYVGPGAIAHLPVAGSTVGVCVDPVEVGHPAAVMVAGYVHVFASLSKVPSAAVHAATNAALSPLC